MLLGRLAKRRQPDLDVLARSADVGGSELKSLLRGGGPSPSLLRRLAPVLGLHTPDLFVIAGVDVPDDLAPGDPTAGSWVPVLVRNAVGCWVAVAKTFLVVTGRYWSAATYGGVGRGISPVTAELLADFCAVLDVQSEDLVTVTGVALPEAPSKAKPAVAGVAKLIWDVRRLTCGQLQEAGNGFRECSVADADRLTVWLTNDVGHSAPVGHGRVRRVRALPDPSTANVRASPRPRPAAPAPAASPPSPPNRRTPCANAPPPANPSPPWQGEFGISRETVYSYLRAIPAPAPR